MGRARADRRERTGFDVEEVEDGWPPRDSNPAGSRQCREVGNQSVATLLWAKSAREAVLGSAAERPREARLHIQRHNARGSEGGRGRGGLAYGFEAPGQHCAAPCRDQAQRRRSAQVGNCSRIDVRPAKGGPRSARGRQTARDSASTHGRGWLRPAESRAAPARWACDRRHEASHCGRCPPTHVKRRKKAARSPGAFPVTLRGPTRSFELAALPVFALSIVAEKKRDAVGPPPSTSRLTSSASGRVSASINSCIGDHHQSNRRLPEKLGLGADATKCRELPADIGASPPAQPTTA